MEDDDNEILDWGNEDDEHHETPRKHPFNNGQRDTDDFEADDSISLGDEDEDNQEFLSYRSEGTNGHSTNARDIIQSQLRAATPQKTLMITSAKQESQHCSGEATRGIPSTPGKFGSAEDSPRQKNDSRDQTSPQLSQPNPGRLTHALPPKPVTTKVPPYLPPSHPSIVEATSMIISPRAGGRETKKSNGVSSGTSIPPTADELPHNWEYREARNGAGKYYYNKETHISTWEKPVSSIPSASSHAESRSRRRRSTSTDRRQRTPPDSNLQSQTTRPSRNSTHKPPEREMDDASRAAPNGLTYEDRHYRPGGESSSASVENRATERLSEVVNNRVSSQSRYDRMQPASPPPPRRRARSSSPHESRASYLQEKEKEYQSSRGNSHSTRGQNASTNDPQRGFDTFQPDSGYAENHWVRPPHPLDFPRSDRDSSRRRGRRQDDDQPMVDEHPDNRNRSSLKRRESSREPNRDREPPRPSELREVANQNPVFLSAPRRGSTPPLSRDRDHYEPMDRGYRAPPEDDRSNPPCSSRKDRPLRPDRQAHQPIPTISSGPEVPSNRRRDRDLAPSPIFTHPSRRVGERDYDRNRREQQTLERDELPRRPVDYPPAANQIPEQSKRHYDREPSRPHPSDFDRSSPDHVGQSSHRKRAPLPPQATTFLTSSNTSAYRDAPPHSSGAPVAPRSYRIPDTGGSDGNVPVGPRSMNYGNEEPVPRSGPTGGTEYDRNRGRNSSRQLDRIPNDYPTPLLPTNTAMDVDEEGPLSTRGPSPTPHRTTRNGPKHHQEDNVELSSGSRWSSNYSTTGGPSRPTASSVSSENGGPPHLPGDGYSETRDFDRSRQEEPSGRKDERTDRYPGSKARSKSGGRPEHMKPPAQPSSGTNNIPIGNRRPSAPPLAAASLPPIRYNPDARPPPSTLIDPAKARELLPPGKESYERPADLEIADTPQVRTANDASSNLRHFESSEPQPGLPPTATAPNKSRRRSRFDKPGALLEPRSNVREPSPFSDKGTKASQSDASDRRAATPPPLSREPSMVASMERLSSRLTDPEHQSDARSHSPSLVPVHSDTQTHHPVAEQRLDQPLLNRFSSDMILHEHLLPEKQLHLDQVSLVAHSGNAPAFSRAGNRGSSQTQTVEQPQEHVRLPAVPDPPTSLSHRLSNDKPRQRRGSILGRDEKPREMELSFHNAHAELGPEERIGFQDRLERPPVQRRGASLLDRLSTGNARSQDSAGQQSLRDRIIPSKREREDMIMEEGMRDASFEGEDGIESKRARRKGGRARTRGGRRGAP